MGMTGIETLDRAPHLAGEWIDAICDGLGWADRMAACRMLCAALHAIRDAVPPDEAAALGRGLPVILRGLYFEDWRPEDARRGPARRDDLIAARINAVFPGMARAEAELCAAAVLDLLCRRRPRAASAIGAWRAGHRG